MHLHTHEHTHTHTHTLEHLEREWGGGGSTYPQRVLIQLCFHKCICAAMILRHAELSRFYDVISTKAEWRELAYGYLQTAQRHG